ncbi:MAG: antibiotic biosynthesis monooxygenase family protein [Candidatus Limnocylindrales bacterium]
MIARHITFDVHPDRTADFERFFAESYRPPVTAVPGFVACDLLCEIDHPERYQMVFRWEHPEDAVAWRMSEVHQALQPELNTLHAGMAITAYTLVP